jgi:hypothetical protein
MNYIEELNAGDAFMYEDINYVLGIDFKKTGDRLAICLTNGNPKWFSANSIVKKISLYTIDAMNNILPIKENKNEVSI